MQKYDFHTHSVCSDGHYSPAELIQRAHAVGLSVLALTDHDTVKGIESARRSATALGLGFVPGIELSVRWENKTIHLIGLGIDIADSGLRRHLERLAALRQSRAQAIDQHLSRHGITGLLEEATRLASEGLVTRTHFARALVKRGHAQDVRDVFRRFLTPGKPGHVASDWPELAESVEVIRGAGGLSVMAHPLRYPLTRTALRRLASQFKAEGGVGLEVISGNPQPAEVRSLAALAREFEFSASLGSDFHGPDEAWPKLGRLPGLPPDLQPIWAQALGVG